LAVLLHGGAAFAQEGVHLPHAGKLPPGAIGAQQLLRGGPLPGYFQPVEIRAPEGAVVSFAIDNRFSAEQSTPVKLAMLIAPVYRMRVTEIPNHPGEEVYPTVELINRIYPPVGEEFRFPIPIELTRADLELALAGKFVTRVVYLEDPGQALPVNKGADKEQTYFEVRPSDDPLEVADRLGRPVAIVRLGGRLPDPAGPDATFMYNSPPLLVPNALDLERRSEPGPESIDPAPRPAGATARRLLKVQPDIQTARRRPTIGKPAVPSMAVEVQEVKHASAVREPADTIGKSAWQLDKPAPVGVSVTDEP
jgi:hypothetical protein